MPSYLGDSDIAVANLDCPQRLHIDSPENDQRRPPGWLAHVSRILDIAEMLVCRITTDRDTSYSHADLATLDADGITSEMTELETILLSMIGKVPTYMRPPYFSTNALALQTLGSLGYHVIK